MVDIEQATTQRTADGWLISWRIHNPAAQPVVIHSAWLPHGRFRSAERALDPPLRVPAGAEALLDSTVAWDEPPGTSVENGFLILRLEGARVFARLRITSLPDGSPAAVCENLTSS